MSAEPSRAVFLSYASQDAGAVLRIAEALRAAGVEVWFDQNELVGGDAWDQKIRKQIKECALFVPVISAATQARLEGYFRLEWKLAASRTHTMADAKPFLLPVVIDATHDTDAHVPEEFRAVQWTRLPGGETPEKFCARVKKLLGGEAGAPARPRPAPRAEPGAAEPAPASEKKRPRWPLALGACLVIGVGMFFALRPNHSAPIPPAAATPVSTPAPESEARKFATRARELSSKLAFTRDDLAVAEDLARKATELEPASSQVWAARAWVQAAYINRSWDLAAKRSEDTQAFANRALAINPGEADALYALCVVRRIQGAFAESESLARRALAASPRDGYVFRALSEAVRRQGRADEAEEILHEALRLNPRDALTQYGLGSLYANLASGVASPERLATGLQYFDAALAVEPFASALVQKAGLVAAWQGDLVAMRATLNQLEKMSSSERAEDRSVFIAMWGALLERDAPRVQAAAALTARTYFEDNTVAEPKAWMIALAQRVARKETLARLEWQNAERVLRERLKEHPESLRDQAQLAMTLAWLERSAEAKELIAPIELAARDLAERSVVNGWLAKYYAAVGDASNAVRYLKKIVDHATFFTRHSLRLDPWWDKLRGQPEFAALLAEPKKETMAAPPALSADDKSVAVLAFDNRSDDKDAEYFSDGISEELINALGRVPGLTVKGRTSAFFFKGKNATAQEIAEKLGVNYLVRGSVRKAGGKVRITAQLSRAATDEILWSSEPLEREVKDVFAVQDEIVGLIAKSLSVQMGVPSRAVHQVNPDALTALLQGRQFWVLRTPEGFARARMFFNQAVTLDPDWASAHAALASLEAIEASFLRGDGGSVDERMALATREAKRALELDATLGEPHATLGKIAMEYRQHGEAEQEFRRALALEPNNALVHDWYGDFSVTQGRLDVAIAEYGRAMELEPLSPYIMFDLAWEMMNVRRYREALALVERAATLTPSGTARYALRRARLLFELGRNPEAEAALHSYLESPMTGSDPQFLNEAVWCLRAFGTSVDRERVTAELLRNFPNAYASGVIQLMLGQLDQAFPLLERVPPIFVQQIFWEPVFDPVRDTPRFRQLLEKIGSTEQYHVARETQSRLLREQAAKK